MKQIVLSNGDVALVSDEDFYAIFNFGSWSRMVNVKGEKTYAITWQGSRKESRGYLMHRLIAERMGLNLSEDIDHKNGNKIDNTRENLRSASRSQNNINRSSPGIGVRRLPSGNFQAYFTRNKKQYNLGVFS